MVHKSMKSAKRQTQGWPMAERLMHYVLRIPESECWYWDGNLDKDGYGVTWNGLTTKKAHRESYKEFVDHIPDGMAIHHRCGERSCINPRHLECVDAREHNTMHASHRHSKRPCCTKCNGPVIHDGYGYKCRPCLREYSRLYQKLQGERISERRASKRKKATSGQR
jgi:hypothetical protein